MCPHQPYVNLMLTTMIVKSFINKERLGNLSLL
jgi:hypothetical protein